MVLCRNPADLPHLDPLRQDPRIDLFVAERLTPHWIEFARRSAAGVLLLTEGDPLDAVVYVRTAHVYQPLMVTVNRKYEAVATILERDGIARCLSLPLDGFMRDRIVVLLSRAYQGTMSESDMGLSLDAVRRVAHYRGRSLSLSQREFAVLHCLAQHVGEPVTTARIFDYVWHGGDVTSHQIVDVYVCQLRRKLGRIGLGSAIKTLRGCGYMLADTDRGAAASGT